MALYEVRDIARNSWTANGPVSNGAWIKTNRWRDVVRWWRDNQDTTASINATLFIDGKQVGETYGFFALMGMAEREDKSVRLSDVKRFAG